MNEFGWLLSCGPAVAREPIMPANADDFPPEYIEVGAPDTPRRIAVRAQTGGRPGLLWLGGFKSDMRGTKAQALAKWASEHDRAYVRFDYSGHGESAGDFNEGTIGRWLEESLAVFDAFCRGPQILIGSSMGAWIALLLARAWKARNAEAVRASLAGLVLIAPAVDFTEVLLWQKLPLKLKRAMTEQGFLAMPSQYSSEPYVMTHNLIEEGRNHLLLGGMIEIGCPVRILQGVQDPDVPWDHAVELVSHLAQDDVVLTLVKDGDHRLSRPEDIERLIAAIEEL